MSTSSKEKARQMRAARDAELARTKRHRKVATIVVMMVILGLVAAIIIAGTRSFGSGGENVTGEVVEPANIEAGAFSVGDANAPVTLDLYYDI